MGDSSRRLRSLMMLSTGLRRRRKAIFRALSLGYVRERHGKMRIGGLKKLSASDKGGRLKVSA
jgi:hypothetical protein